MNCYIYNLAYYDEIEFNHNGIICAEDYPSALNRLAEYYGEEDILKVSLEYLCDKPFVIFPKDDDILDSFDNISVLLKEENSF